MNRIQKSTQPLKWLRVTAKIIACPQGVSDEIQEAVCDILIRACHKISRPYWLMQAYDIREPIIGTHTCPRPSAVRDGADDMDAADNLEKQLSTVDDTVSIIGIVRVTYDPPPTE